MSKEVFRSKISTTTLYFDRTPLIAQITRKERRFLQRSGNLVASTARASIVKRKRKSAPGEPPVSRTGKLRQMIRHGVDSSRVCAVAGVLPLLASESRGEAPHTLEYGGRERVRNRAKDYKIGSAAPVRKGKGSGAVEVRGKSGSKTKVVFAKIQTKEQLERAKALNRELYGSSGGYVVIAARPYMNAALRLSENSINNFMKD